MVVGSAHRGKITIERLRIRWKDRLKKDFGKVKPRGDRLLGRKYHWIERKMETNTYIGRYGSLKSKPRKKTTLSTSVFSSSDITDSQFNNILQFSVSVENV